MDIRTRKWTKNCPNCGCEQNYSCKGVLILSTKKNTECNKCRGIKNRKHNGIFEKLCSCGKLLKYTCRQSLNLSKTNNSKCRGCATKESAKLIDRKFQKTNLYRKMMSRALKSSEKNKNKFTEEFREKLRTAKLNQIKKFGTNYNYNPLACKFIEEFGNRNGYNFKHAMNGGEVVVSGYSLDGYDEEKNVVFEYDEPKHNGTGIKKRDKIREERIIKKINPNVFIRYDEEHNIIRDVISGKEIL